MHDPLEFCGPLHAPVDECATLRLVLIGVVFDAQIVGWGSHHQIDRSGRHRFHALEAILMKKIDARCHAPRWSQLAENEKSGVRSYGRLILTMLAAGL